MLTHAQETEQYTIQALKADLPRAIIALMLYAGAISIVIFWLILLYLAGDFEVQLGAVAAIVIFGVSAIEPGVRFLAAPVLLVRAMRAATPEEVAQMRAEAYGNSNLTARFAAMFETGEAPTLGHYWMWQELKNDAQTTDSAMRARVRAYVPDEYSEAL